MGDYADFWKQIDERAAKSKSEVDRTKSEIEDARVLGSKWRFVGVIEGVHWTARHRLLGEVKAFTSEALLSEVKRLNEREQKFAPPVGQP